MIAIPFIYFTLLSLFVYKRHKAFSVAFIVSAIFAVCGLFSILLDFFNLRSDDTIHYNITPIASIAYCGLITMCLSPFIVYPNTKIVNIARIKNDTLLKAFAWLSFIWLIAVIFFSWPFFLRNLASDIQETRTMFSQGEGDSYLLFLPLGVRIPLVILNMLFSCSWILIFLSFYCLLIQKLPSKYFWLYFLASLSTIYYGVLAVDRAKTTYWIISFFVMFFFYKPYMSKQNRKRLQYVFGGFSGVALLYLAYITIGRFGERYYGSVSGSQGGIITYLGQNYINFCFFFDNYTPPVIDVSLIFPFFHKYILGQDSVDAVTIQTFMSFKTGFETGVFYTFIGHIIIAAGKIVAIVFCLCYSLLAAKLLHPFRICAIASPFKALLYLALSSVLFQGLWVHYYTSAPLTFSLFFFLIAINLMGRRNIY